MEDIYVQVDDITPRTALRHQLEVLDPVETPAPIRKQPIRQKILSRRKLSEGGEISSAKRIKGKDNTNLKRRVLERHSQQFVQSSTSILGESLNVSSISGVDQTYANLSAFDSSDSSINATIDLAVAARFLKRTHRPLKALAEPGVLMSLDKSPESHGVRDLEKSPESHVVPPNIVQRVENFGDLTYAGVSTSMMESSSDSIDYEAVKKMRNRPKKEALGGQMHPESSLPHNLPPKKALESDITYGGINNSVMESSSDSIDYGVAKNVRYRTRKRGIVLDEFDPVLSGQKLSQEGRLSHSEFDPVLSGQKLSQEGRLSHSESVVSVDSPGERQSVTGEGNLSKKFKSLKDDSIEKLKKSPNSRSSALRETLIAKLDKTYDLDYDESFENDREITRQRFGRKATLKLNVSALMNDLKVKKSSAAITEDSTEEKEEALRAQTPPFVKNSLDEGETESDWQASKEISSTKNKVTLDLLSSEEEKSGIPQREGVQSSSPGRMSGDAHKSTSRFQEHILSPGGFSSDSEDTELQTNISAALFSLHGDQEEESKDGRESPLALHMSPIDSPTSNHGALSPRSPSHRKDSLEKSAGDRATMSLVMDSPKKNSLRLSHGKESPSKSIGSNTVMSPVKFSPRKSTGRDILLSPSADNHSSDKISPFLTPSRHSPRKSTGRDLLLSPSKGNHSSDEFSPFLTPSRHSPRKSIGEDAMLLTKHSPNKSVGKDAVLLPKHSPKKSSERDSLLSSSKHSSKKSIEKGHLLSPAKHGPRSAGKDALLSPTKTSPRRTGKGAYSHTKISPKRTESDVLLSPTKTSPLRTRRNSLSPTKTSPETVGKSALLSPSKHSPRKAGKGALLSPSMPSPRKAGKGTLLSPSKPSLRKAGKGALLSPSKPSPRKAGRETLSPTETSPRKSGRGALSPMMTIPRQAEKGALLSPTKASPRKAGRGALSPTKASPRKAGRGALSPTKASRRRGGRGALLSPSKPSPRKAGRGALLSPTKASPRKAGRETLLSPTEPSPRKSGRGALSPMMTSPRKAEKGPLLSPTKASPRKAGIGALSPSKASPRKAGRGALSPMKASPRKAGRETLLAPTEPSPRKSEKGALLSPTKASPRKAGRGALSPTERSSRKSGRDALSPMMTSPRKSGRDALSPMMTSPRNAEEGALLSSTKASPRKAGSGALSPMKASPRRGGRGVLSSPSKPSPRKAGKGALLSPSKPSPRKAGKGALLSPSKPSPRKAGKGTLLSPSKPSPRKAGRGALLSPTKASPRRDALLSPTKASPRRDVLLSPTKASPRRNTLLSPTKASPRRAGRSTLLSPTIDIPTSGGKGSLVSPMKDIATSIEKGTVSPTNVNRGAINNETITSPVRNLLPSFSEKRSSMRNIVLTHEQFEIHPEEALKAKYRGSRNSDSSANASLSESLFDKVKRTSLTDSPRKRQVSIKEGDQSSSTIPKEKAGTEKQVALSTKGGKTSKVIVIQEVSGNSTYSLDVSATNKDEHSIHMELPNKENGVLESTSHKDGACAQQKAEFVRYDPLSESVDHVTQNSVRIRQKDSISEDASDSNMDSDSDEEFLLLPVSERKTVRIRHGSPLHSDYTGAESGVTAFHLNVEEGSEGEVSKSSGSNMHESVISTSPKPGGSTSALGTPSERLTTSKARQMTMKEFIQKLADKPMPPPKVVNKAKDKIWLANLLKDGSSSTVRKPPSKIVVAKKTKDKKPLPTALSKSVTREIFTHFAKCKVSESGMNAVMEVSEKYWKNLTTDLINIVNARKGSDEILGQDMRKLMSRQGLITDENSLYALVEKYLPVEDWNIIIPTAFAKGNVYPPVKVIEDMFE